MRRRRVVCLVYMVVAMPSCRVCVVKLCDIFSNCLAIFGGRAAETFVRFSQFSQLSPETPPQIAKAARDRKDSLL